MDVGPFMTDSQPGMSKVSPRPNSPIDVHKSPLPSLSNEGDIIPKKTLSRTLHDTSSKKIIVLSQDTLRNLLEESVVTTLNLKFHFIFKFVEN